jgi:hypothetical protein
VPKKQPKSKSRKPLTISIHGDGIDIDAKISSPSDLADITDSFASQLVARLRDGSPGPTVAPEHTSTPKYSHDFDIVKNVIEHGDPGVLQAIIDLALHKLEQHRTVS